jgi:hypothetical protein
LSLGFERSCLVTRHPAAQDQDVCFLIERCDEQHQERRLAGAEARFLWGLFGTTEVVP